MDQDLIRVFYHELGHFVAREITANNFGLSHTKEIVLRRSEKFSWLYEGSTAPIIPEGQENVTTVLNVPEKIVDLIYGCFFEALYLRIPFKDCFNSNGSGYKDLDHWSATLNQEGIRGGIGKRDEIIQSEEEYFLQLRQSKFFDEIAQMDVASFLKKRGNIEEYEVDIERLKGELQGFLKEHESLFLPYLEKIKELINKYKEPTKKQ